jgi:hypothetical protein
MSRGTSVPRAWSDFPTETAITDRVREFKTIDASLGTSRQLDVSVPDMFGWTSQRK